MTIASINESIKQLYLEADIKDLRKSLLDEGITKIEDAYVRGFQHALAELKMRLEEKQKP